MPHNLEEYRVAFTWTPADEKRVDMNFELTCPDGRRYGRGIRLKNDNWFTGFDILGDSIRKTIESLS